GPQPTGWAPLLPGAAQRLPRRDGSRRLRRALPPQAFPKGFPDGRTHARRADEGDSVRLVAGAGKTARRAHDAGPGLGPPHRVSAWAAAQGIARGPVARAEPSNEIGAKPQRLRQRALPDALVPLDAVGCQQAIARALVAGGGDVVRTVKDNPPK